LRILLYALAGLLLLIVAAVVVGPGFVDWNVHRERIAQEASDLTGRPLSIDGDISLSVIPTPTLSAGGVRMASIEGATDPDLARLAEMRVRVSLLPLLRGQVEVQSVALVDPVILLEVLPDGRRNWDLGVDSDQDPEPNGGSGTPPRADVSEETRISLDEVAVQNGTFVYRAPGRELRFEAVEAVISAGSLRGPFSAQGTGRFRGGETAFEASLGRLHSGRPASLGGQLEFAGSALSFSGSLDRDSESADAAMLQGDLRAEGENLATLLASIGASGLPAQLAQSFSLRTQIAYRPEHLVASNANLKLGDVAFTGEVDAALSPEPLISVTLDAKRLDVDRLLAASVETDETSGETQEATGGQETDASGEAGGALPADIAAVANVTVDAVVYRGQVVRQFQTELSLADGSLAVTRATALLPGGSDVSLSGRITTPPEGPEFDGKIEAVSDNFRSLLGWLGADVSAVPPERLRRMNLRSQLSYGGGQMTLTRLDLRADVSRLTGGVAIAFRERPGFGIGLSVDKLNLDAYLPRESEDPAQADESQNAAGGEQAAEAMSLFESFDANLDLRIGELVFQQQSLRDLRVDGTLQRGSLTLRDLRYQEFGGTSGGFSGTLSSLGDTPQIEGQLDLRVQEPRTTAEAFGLDRDLLQALGQIEVSSSVLGDLAALEIDGDVKALGGTLDLKGSLAPLLGSYDLDVAAAHPSLPGLANAFGTELNPALGGLNLSSNVSGSATEVTFQGVDGSLGGIEVSGDVSADLVPERPIVTLDLATGEIPVTEIFGRPGKASGGGGQGGRLDPRWSREPIDLIALQALDAAIKVRSKALLFDDLRLEDSDLEADLTNGVLDISKLNGTLFGGTLMVSGQVQTVGRVQADLAVTALEMRIEEGLSGGIWGGNKVSGPLTINAALTTVGRSQADLVSRLDGTGDLSGTLTTATSPEGQIGAALFDLLGKKVKEIRGVADAVTVLFRSFGDADSEIAGTFNIDDGVLTSSDARIVGRDATANLQGTADIAAWQLGSLMRVFRSVDTDEPYLTFDFSGRLDEPNIRIGGQPFKSKKPKKKKKDAKTISETLGLQGVEPEEDAEAEEAGDTKKKQKKKKKKIKPEDVLKEFLKGLD